MKTISFKKPRNKSSDDALIPLINIVFLLLIFFMAAGSIQPSTPVDVNHPVVGNVDNPIQAVSAQMVLTKANEIYWNNNLISMTQLQQFIQKQKPTRINLHLDQQVKAIDLDAVLNVIRQHQVSTVNLITEQVMVQ